MKIFVIPSWYPSKTKPNNGSFFKEQAQALLGQGYDVILLDGTFRSREAYFSRENYKMIKYNDEGMITYQYVIPNFMLSRNAWMGIEMAKWSISKVFDAAVADFGYPDIIHAHSFYPAGYIACLLGKKYNIPVVVSEHSSRVLNKSLSKQYVKYLYRVVESADAFLCVSQKLVESVEQITNINSKGIVFHNMVSDKFVLCNDKKKHDRFQFLSVGNLIESKRHDIIIDAFCKTFTTNDNMQLRIVGDGNQKKNLENKVKGLNRTKQIIFTGQLSREDVSKEMQKSDVFVMASEFETFGIVYIEAMACGNPVITFKNGGSDNLINKENGILLERNSVEDFSSAMKYMFENRDNYSSSDISNRCITEHGKSTYKEQLYELYNCLIKNKAGFSDD